MKITGRTVLTYLTVVLIFFLIGFLGNDVTTVIADRIPMPRKQTIIIDAGHGGEDGGAVSVSGIKESQINLEISLRLNELLHLLGYRTVMIRTADESVSQSGDTVAARKASDLRQRVNMVNGREEGILISIHQNTFLESKYSGAQVFYGRDEESRRLGEAMQEALIENLNPGSNRHAKKAEGIYLMQHIERPGILIECGFLSNYEEEALLRTTNYQQKLSCVIAAALGQFLTE